MLKLSLTRLTQKSSLGNFLISRYFSVLSFNSRNRPESKEYKYSKTFRLARNLAFSLGISYALYDFYCKRKQWVQTFGTVEKILKNFQVHALDVSVNEKEKISPRTMFNFLADVAEKTKFSVVYIEIVARHPITRQSIPISNGSGFIVKSDGLILTNAHVVSNQGRVIVKLYDGTEYEGIVESYDTESDLATVRIKAKDLPVLPLGESSNLRAGEFVIAMGNPLTLSHTITAGVISSASRQGKDLGLHRKSDYIQTDAAVNVGNSGGPLVNLDGEAIGINTMKVTEGISFAIPSDRAVEFLERTEKAKKESWNPFKSSDKKQKYLGITMLTLTPTVIRELQERNPDFPNVGHGVMVWRVMINSPSFEAGIKHGDVITGINGKEIHSASDIYSLLKSEDVLDIHIVRRKKEFNIKVQLMDPVLP
ncbi:serine protease HTRA2, mitochondrial-like [Argiope bruennichi]|uniref:serine protease HTRA2, mitochondrial-like n=1 Tax=Argiope bruennichi TaxID=94029 RepID=UPI00249401EA|nr:serine protease HTRA2, mitochondrial-like [Argiope bruennichi]